MTFPLRFPLAFLGCLLLIFFETGFLASLPGPLRFTPAVFAVGVYAVQLRGWRSGTWLIAAFGLCVDAFGIAPVPLQTLAYGAAAVAVALSSERLFSNRSLYGLLGCGLVGWAAWVVVQTIVWVFVGMGGTGLKPVLTGGLAYAVFVGWRAALLLVCLMVLFYAVPRRTRLPFTH